MENKDFTIKTTKHGVGLYEINNRNISYLDVPEGVTYIADPDSVNLIFTFSKCKKLTEIHLSSTLKSINMYAFNDCRSLTKIE